MAWAAGGFDVIRDRGAANGDRCGNGFGEPGLRDQRRPHGGSSAHPGQCLPQGTTIAVCPTGGTQPLYTEVLGANAMQVTVSQTAPPPAGPGFFNTGNYVFTQTPIYFSYSPAGEGTTYFDPA
jgi:hypothetical protein